MAFWNKNRKHESIARQEERITPPSFDPVHRESGFSPQDPSLMPPPHDRRYFEGFGQVDLCNKYPLVFYLMENNVCTRKIEYTCYSGQRPNDILPLLKAEGLIPDSPRFSYRILYWPTRNGMSTLEQYDDSQPKAICEFHPNPGTVFIIQQCPVTVEPMELYTLYGCPTAAMPEQKSVLQNQSIDVIHYD